MIFERQGNGARIGTQLTLAATFGVVLTASACATRTISPAEHAALFCAPGDAAAAATSSTAPTLTSSATRERPTAFGTLKKSQITAVIRGEGLPQIERCYEDALEEGPPLAGRIAVRFLIESSGRVGWSCIAESRLSAEIDRCVLQVFRSLRFPSPRGGGVVYVTYPLVLRPRDAGG